MAKKIPVGDDLFAIVDDDDFDLVSRFFWHKVESGRDPDYTYATAKVRMHRLIIDCPKGLHVDHINGDTLDNRKCNLRICTNAQNQQNSKSRKGSSQYKGVSFNQKKKKWYGSFSVLGKSYFCGMFDDEIECAKAVDKKRREVCGHFASQNIPHDD